MAENKKKPKPTPKPSEGSPVSKGQGQKLPKDNK